MQLKADIICSLFIQLLAACQLYPSYEWPPKHWCVIARKTIYLSGSNLCSIANIRHVGGDTLYDGRKKAHTEIFSVLLLDWLQSAELSNCILIDLGTKSLEKKSFASYFCIFVFKHRWEAWVFQHLVLKLPVSFFLTDSCFRGTQFFKVSFFLSSVSILGFLPYVSKYVELHYVFACYLMQWQYLPFNGFRRNTLLIYLETFRTKQMT